MAASNPNDITACPDWGKGGSYTLDPATGIRTLVQRTEDASAEPATPATTPPATQAATPPAAQPIRKGA